jgi:hypothetical protein
MVSMDRQPVLGKTGLIQCPLRDRQVAIARCLECGRLIDRDEAQPPRYVVCDARIITGWLGLDDL